jgi:hypothetical protein
MMLPMNDQEQRNSVLGRIYAKADVKSRHQLTELARAHPEAFGVS